MLFLLMEISFIKEMELFLLVILHLLFQQDKAIRFFVTVSILTETVQWSGQFFLVLMFSYLVGMITFVVLSHRNKLDFSK